MSTKFGIALHPELQDECFSHLFIVNSGHKEEKNIGKHVKFINPKCIVEHEIFTIGSLQFDYKGQLCYRVYFDGDTYGRVASFDEVEIL